MKQNFTTNSADIKRTVSRYYEQLNTHTFDNSGETDQFLEKHHYHNLPNIKDKRILNLKTRQKRQSLGPDGFIGEFY